MSAATQLSPYLMLVLLGFLPNEIWRLLGLIMARGLSLTSASISARRTILPSQRERLRVFAIVVFFRT